MSTVAVVLTGAAARGAFQAGALARILPELESQGMRPTIYLGTSAGAINAALYGSFAHLPVEQAAAQLLDVWRTMDEGSVIRPPLLSLIGDGLRFLPGALLGIGRGITSVFDTAPLQRTAQRVLNSEQIALNVASGVIDAVGVAATRVPPAGSAPGNDWHVADAHSVLFLDTTLDASAAADPDRALRVAPGPITADQVLASSAIPVAFPAIEVSSPEPFRGWYLDGGVRLNAPLRPAPALGADHLVVISAHSLAYPRDFPIGVGQQPDVLDAAATTMQAVLADRVIEDLDQIKTRNRWLEEGSDLHTSGGRPLHTMNVLEASPDSGELADLAADILKSKRFDPQSAMLGRFLRGLGDGPGAMELLSYIYFDDTYFAAQIDVGIAAAEKALSGGWQV